MPDEGPYGIGSTTWPGLAKLVEEMGELTQVLMKLMAKGGDAGEHWDGKGKLLDRIIGEAGDVDAALTFFRQANHLDSKAIRAQRKLKLDRFRYWHKDCLERAKRKAKTEKVVKNLKLKKEYSCPPSNGNPRTSSGPKQKKSTQTTKKPGASTTASSSSKKATS